MKCDVSIRVEQVAAPEPIVARPHRVLTRHDASTTGLQGYRDISIGFCGVTPFASLKESRANTIFAPAGAV